jgi:hypothetical protein
MYLVTGVVINPYIASNVGIVLCTEWILSFPGIMTMYIVSLRGMFLSNLSVSMVMFTAMFPINLSSNMLFIGILLGNHINTYACPSNINSLWNMGFLLYLSTSLQIVTGILLALHYT